MNYIEPNSMNYPVIDLFCGVGGLSHGFYQEKFNIIAGIDFDQSCKYAYEKNNKAPFLHKDLTKTNADEIISLFPNGLPKVLVGCAPCQAFSNLSNKYKNNDKWKLLYSFGKLIEQIQPEIISMENVPQLLTYDRGEVFKDFIKILEKCEYKYSYQVVDASNYGVPQNRARLILLASKYGDIKLLPKTHKKHRTVRDAIGNLPPINDGEAHPTDYLHRAAKLSDLNKTRIMATPEGGGWKDWDENLLLDCHKKESGKTFKSVYGRMSWDKVAPTLTTQCTGYGNGRYGHPEQHRAISLREAAILQSFPKNYSFHNPKEPFSKPKIQRHIGNAVPVLLGRVIAKTIKQHINEHYNP